LRRCLRWAPDDRPQDLGEVAGAIRDVYRQATGADYEREEPRPGEMLADGLNNRAVSLLDLGKPQEARAVWEEALHVDPYHAEATHNRGLLDWRSGRCTDLDLVGRMQAVCAAHQSDASRVLMARVHLERGDCKEALQAIEGLPEDGALRREVRSLRKL